VLGADWTWAHAPTVGGGDGVAPGEGEHTITYCPEWQGVKRVAKLLSYLFFFFLHNSAKICKKFNSLIVKLSVGEGAWSMKSET